MLLDNSAGEDTWELAPGLSWTPLCAPFTFADFNLIPFTIINCNQEHNSFSELCEFFQCITEAEGGIGDLNSPGKQ